jgi:hypothetical protein
MARGPLLFLASMPLAALIGITLSSAPAAAFTNEERAAFCPVMGDISANLMGARQDGKVLSDAMRGMEGSLSDPLLGPIVRAMIIAAWERPRFSTQEYKDRAVVDFRNEIETQCYSGRIP